MFIQYGILIILMSILLPGCVKTKEVTVNQHNPFMDYVDSVEHYKKAPFDDNKGRFSVSGSDGESTLSDHQSSRRHRERVVDTLPVYREAKLDDIPIPLSAFLQSYDPKKSSTLVDSIMLTYTVFLSRNDIMLFYDREMERLGWQKLAFVNDEEALLLFSKPTKVCSISLRSNSDERKGIIMVIITGKKEIGYSNE
ncbi:MAG: hypothetical protein NTX86_03045 [Candidatus Dependentiae bacterium]|nr:hypothetical protein [Candidatus Dependentiae bacterium]